MGAATQTVCGYPYTHSAAFYRMDVSDGRDEETRKRSPHLPVDRKSVVRGRDGHDATEAVRGIFGDAKFAH